MIVQDADLEYDPTDYAALLHVAAREKAQVVYGSRFAAGRPAMAIRHRVGNRLLIWLTNRCYGSSLTDMETCYKLIDRTLLQQIETVSNSFDFEPEITAKILKRGIPIHEVADPVPWTEFRRGKEDLLEGLLPGGLDASAVPLLTPIAHCVLCGTTSSADPGPWPR